MAADTNRNPANPPPPARLPLALPLLGEPEIAAVAEVIRSGWITQGPQVAAFEREFAQLVGAGYACAVCNCTAALHLALRAVGVAPGDEVITVSHSFIATANAIRYLQAVPVFADVEPHTYNIDPAMVAPLIGPRTKALLLVHQLGMPCDMARLTVLARQHGLPIIEDAACAIGSEILWHDRWEPVGRPHGDIACFSFHPRKLVTTGDGGMLTTNNAAFDSQFRLWRQHGMNTSDLARHSAAGVVFESYTELGYNYRLTDIQAAVGRCQLQRLPEMVRERRARAERYRTLLAPITGLELPHEPAWARGNWQSYCVRLPHGVAQRAVMERLLVAGIATRRGVMCSHREPAYPPGAWRAASELCHSEAVQDQGLVLPLFPGMTDAQQDRVATELTSACY